MATIDDIVIAKPCSALWTEMKGDDRARFCQLCRKTVYDTAGLDACELERLIAAPTPPCLRVHRDGAGRVLTRDRIARAAATAAMVVAAACTGGGDSGDSAVAGGLVDADVAVKIEPPGEPAIPEVATPPVAPPPEMPVGRVALHPRTPDTGDVEAVAPHAEMGGARPLMGTSAAPTTGTPPAVRPRMGEPAPEPEPKMGKVAPDMGMMEEAE